VTAVVGVGAVGAAVALILFEKKPAKTQTSKSVTIEPYAPGTFAGISALSRF
jgi:hypothetical protein